MPFSKFVKGKGPVDKHGNPAAPPSAFIPGKGFPPHKPKQDTAAQDAKESPAQHKRDLASGKDKPGPGDKASIKRAALLAQLKKK